MTNKPEALSPEREADNKRIAAEAQLAASQAEVGRLRSENEDYKIGCQKRAGDLTKLGQMLGLQGVVFHDYGWRHIEEAVTRLTEECERLKQEAIAVYENCFKERDAQAATIERLRAVVKQLVAIAGREYEKQGFGQTFERLCERGGLGVLEILALMADAYERLEARAAELEGKSDG